MLSVKVIVIFLILHDMGVSEDRSCYSYGGRFVSHIVEEQIHEGIQQISDCKKDLEQAKQIRKNKQGKFCHQMKRNVYSIELKRLRRTWLESVEADMTDRHEIDREDVHDRKKLIKNVMKRKSNPIEKTDSKPIINSSILFVNLLLENQSKYFITHECVYVPLRLNSPFFVYNRNMNTIRY